jgi:D-sedoheptulose 7-phosphate isomerase
MFSVDRYLGDYVAVLSRLDSADVEALAQVLLAAWRSRRTVFCCGNGGSAANASHFAADLTKLTAPPTGQRLRAMALNENIAAISAIGNDLAYEEIFAEQLRAFMAPKDVLIGFSTSGSSPNVLRAIEYANDAGAITVGVTGRKGTALAGLAHHSVTVQSTSVQHIEDASMVLGHLLCLRTRELIAQEGTEVSFREKAAVLRGLRVADRAADRAAAG